MEYILKSGLKLNIRSIEEKDASDFLEFMKVVHSETKFLGREGSEFTETVDDEIKRINEVRTDENIEIFVAEIDNKIVGQITVAIVRNKLRYLHRARIGIMILQAWTGKGIGGKLMQEMINWCNNKSPRVEQIELEVVVGNDKAYNMYKNFGFVEFGRLPNAFKYLDGTYADQYFMIKNLKH